MLVGDRFDDEPLFAAEWPSNEDFVAGAEQTIGLGRLAVDVDLAALAGLLLVVQQRLVARSGFGLLDVVRSAAWSRELGEVDSTITAGLGGLPADPPGGGTG